MGATRIISTVGPGTSGAIILDPTDFDGALKQTITDVQAMANALDELGKAIKPQGTLYVAPYYCQVDGSEVAIQLNAANDGVSFRFTPKNDLGITTWAFHVAAVATQGNATISLYDVTTGTPTLVTDYEGGGSSTILVDSTGWFSGEFTSVQLYRGRTYEWRINGEAGADFSLSGRRWNTTQGSMFPDGCSSETTTDNWSSTSDLTQNSKPALLNFMLNVTEPSKGVFIPSQLFYARKTGQYIYIPDSGLVSIPEAGVALDLSGATADTLYYVYGYDSSGLTLEYSATGTAITDGIKHKSGDTTKVFLGLIYPKQILGSGYQGPVDIDDRRLVAYPGRDVTLNKLCPYHANTLQTVSTGAWTILGSTATDYRVEFLLLPDDIVSIQFDSVCSQSRILSLAIDSTTEPYPHVKAAGSNDNSNESLVAAFSGKLSPGFHYSVPMLYNSFGSDIYALLYYHEDNTGQKRMARSGSVGGIRNAA